MHVLDIKRILGIVFLCVVFVLLYRYQQYELNKNFYIVVNTSCNPKTEKCFISTDPSSDTNFDSSAYKKVKIKANIAPVCLEEHSCKNFVCPENSVTDECDITYCSTENLSDGEKCLDN